MATLRHIIVVSVLVISAHLPLVACGGCAPVIISVGGTTAAVLAAWEADIEPMIARASNDVAKIEQKIVGRNHQIAKALNGAYEISSSDSNLLASILTQATVSGDLELTSSDLRILLVKEK